MAQAKGSPVADLGDQPAVRTTLTKRPDGSMVQERVPSGRFVKVVKPSGSVDRVPIHNGRASKMGSDDPYKAWIEATLWSSGSVPYGKCLQTLDHEITHGYLPTKWYRARVPVVPEHLRDRNPCRVAANGGPINQANACACIEELILWRKQWQASQMEKAEVKSAALLQSEASKGLAEAVRGVAEVVRDLRDSNRQPPRPPPPAPRPVSPDEIEDYGPGEPDKDDE